MSLRNGNRSRAHRQRKETIRKRAQSRALRLVDEQPASKPDAKPAETAAKPTKPSKPKKETAAKPTKPSKPKKETVAKPTKPSKPKEKKESA